ncbi:MAG: M23 family metallopeptidase [Candidatus Eremiobacterota bacterium]
MRNRIIIYITVIIFLLTCYSKNPAIMAQDVIKKDTSIEITTKKNDTSIDFHIKNKMAYDITITVEFTLLNNLASDMALPYTETIGAGKNIKAFTLYMIDTGDAWKYKYKYSCIPGSLYALHNDSYIYSLPYASGSSYYLSQGYNGTFSHFGEEAFTIDWAMPEGTGIYAARDGTVISTRYIYSRGGNDKKYMDHANYILIRHDDGTIGEYFHFRKNGVYVIPGQEVKAGDLIGFAGSTGYSTAPHLHFGVYKAVDGYTRQTVPVKFRTMNADATELQQGIYYTAP